MEVDRRTVMIGTAGAVALAAAPAMAKTTKAPDWYRKAIVIDGLGGINDPYGAEDDLRISDRAWAEMRQTGLSALRDTIVPVGNQVDSWEQVQKNLADYHNLLRANPDRLTLVAKAADIPAAKAAGKLAVILGTQDSAMAGPALDRIAELKKNGIRAVQLTYNLANLSGDGSIEPRNAGITNLGKATIERIESEKLLLDLAHGGARTMEEAAAYAKRPPTISHTGARAVYDHPRNSTDAAIKAVADKGGVIGVYFMPYLAADMKPSGTMLLDHIDHIAKVAGEDHISIGTDGGVLPLVIDAKAIANAKKDNEQRVAAGIAAPGEAPDVFTVVRDYNSIDKLERVGADLMKRGWTTGQVEKLLGANLMRLYADVWGG
jgi:membrane dipeptidase